MPVSSLAALAEQARRSVEEAAGSVPTGALVACMDARMGEVYWGAFQPGTVHAPETVGAPPSMLGALLGQPIAAAAGKGLAAFPDIALSLQLPPARVFAAAEPHARDVARLAVHELLGGAKWLDPAEALPVYLRDEVVRLAKEGRAGPL
jgi:tRNA threonylcarbamoyladenosine biosynthesis protein TsaB